MKLVLPTQPAFLRTYFPATRKSLGGSAVDGEVSVSPAARVSQVTIFDSYCLSQSRVFSKSLAAFLGVIKEKQFDFGRPKQKPEIIENPNYAPEIFEYPAQAPVEGPADNSYPPKPTTEDVVPSNPAYEPVLEYEAAAGRVGSNLAEKISLYKNSLGNLHVKATKKALGLALTAVIGLSLLTGAVLAVPAAYYTFFPADVIEMESPESGTAFGGEFSSPREKEPEEIVERYEPPVDPTLPEGDWLIIPRIGVRTPMQPTEDPEDALGTGVWWVPDFGGPGYDELPMILAGHRYGWQWWWKDDYWKYHSFYLLPDTEPGDRIEIISNQQKWTYEIYAGAEGDAITDYNADIILYTCKYLTGPIRYFRYARLIDPTANTQAVSSAN